MLRALVATVLFLAVVIATIARPRGVPEWASALGGAALVIALGMVGPADAARAVASDWNVLAFFVGMTGLAAVAERSGFFVAAAELAERLAAGSGRRLLAAVIGLGVAISAFLSNDATALILTPVVYGLVVALGIDALPYVLACTFMADAASLILPVSNPVNLLVLDGLGLPLVRYLTAVEPAALAAAALTGAGLLWLFRRSVPQQLPAGGTRPGGARVPRVWAGLGVIGAAFVAGGLLGAPLGIVACAGFVLLLGLEGTAAGALYRRPLEGVSWQILGYVSGMVVLVAALERLGVVTLAVGSVLEWASGSPALAGIAASLLAAVGSNLVNNVPMTLVMVSGIQGAHLAGPVREAAAYGTIIGADLGPNLTTVGSLATVLWLLILRERGLEVRAVDYLRVGLVITPPILVISTLLMVAMLH
ncbi:MAG: ArsB/NhaD family transporter [Candidatus Limnocylindrales bacterium]